MDFSEQCYLAQVSESIDSFDSDNDLYNDEIRNIIASYLVPDFEVPQRHVQLWILHSLHCNILNIHHLQWLCESAQKILQLEPNVLHLRSPITIVGNVHGQFYDVLELFCVSGFLPETNFLFLGNYINRGNFSVCVLTLFLAYKVRYPGKMHMLRGSHEAAILTQTFSFYEECLHYYGTPRAWELFMGVLECLPLSAIVGQDLFCVHGGLSPGLDTIRDIDKLDRFGDVPGQGPMYDLLWSNPKDSGMGWGIERSGEYTFGADIAEQWNHANGTRLITRAHQLVMEGYAWTHEGNTLTVFSAPNYCYRVGNDAAFLQVLEKDFQIIQFQPAPKSCRRKLSV